jgi:hypothetical protein
MVFGSSMAVITARMRIHRIPLENLLPKKSAVSQADDDNRWSAPIDKSRWFVCPTTTPLYYAPVYQELSHEQQLRYNQLTAVLFNELISFFETEFASSVCAALALGSERTCDDRLRDCLREFIAEERQHTEWWAQLVRLSEPDRYCSTRPMILRVPRTVRAVLRYLTRRPTWFPAVFWIMLALEERSLDISRRCQRMNPDDIDPHYLAAYRDHMKDETRHVHIDWHLIETYYANRSLSLRRLNAWLLLSSIARFFLPPTRSAIRVVRTLASEHCELKPLLGTMKKQLRQLGSDRAYQEMMYSRESTPITFRLFDRFPEMHRAHRVLQTYTPEAL